MFNLIVEGHDNVAVNL